MARLKAKIALGCAVLRQPQILKAGLGITRFFFSYMRKFRPVLVGRRLVLHSHLPPLNSPAYGRFINEHLLGRTEGPSHAQVGLTNACPQNCSYCYNKERTGHLLDTPALLRIIRELKSIGVVWIGFTGGEPLLNKDIVKITEASGGDCAVKLFTTGSSLTPGLAADLGKAGLFSVSISLDHWVEEEHDRARCTPGAYRDALRAIEIFKNVGTLHVGVSAVLTKKMMAGDEVEEFLSYLFGLGIHEAWLSEAKPSVEAFWNKDAVITEGERRKLVALQDRYNKTGRMTVNYLAHFEGREHFGCNAGHKMVYVDAFGEVSPCVFIPMTFGNAREKPIRDIFAEMKQYFPSEESCFINKNFGLLRKHSRHRFPLGKEESLALMDEVEFGPYSRFFQIFYE